MEKAWLEEQLAAGKSYREIARRTGYDPSTVSHRARRYSLASIHVSIHTARGGIPRNVLCELVDEGLSIREIAARLERSPTTVRHWIRVHELQTRLMRARATSKARTEPGAVVFLHCRRHGRTTFIRRRDGGNWRCRRCRWEAVTRRRKRVKEILVREAGGRCALCGYDRYVGALGFHHLDPAEKRVGINRLGASLSRARIEAQKCVLLCANCHAEVEAGVAGLSFRPDAGPMPVSG